MPKNSRTFFFLLLVFWSKLSAAEPQKLGLFDFKQPGFSACDTSRDSCYTVRDLVKQTLRYSYDSRESIELLFQARNSSVERLGRILPQLNLSSGMSGILETSTSFVGFLFPNRWLDWQASRILADAEMDSYKSLLANRANSVHAIYYNIELQRWMVAILDFYQGEVQKTIDYLRSQREAGSKQVGDEDFAILENLKSQLNYQNAAINNLSASFPLLAYTIGMPLRGDWNNFDLERTQVVSLRGTEVGQFETYWEPALKKSTELSNIEKLIKASEVNKKSNYFDLFDPASGNSFGLGYGQRIKIAKSKIEVLAIQKERTMGQINVNINKHLNDYNDALSQALGMEDGLKHLEALRTAVEMHVNDTHSPLTVFRVSRYFETASSAALKYVAAFFMLKSAETNLDRLGWTGPIYQQVSDYVAKDVQRHYEQLSKRRSFFHILKEKIRSYFGLSRKTKMHSKFQRSMV